MPDSIRANNRAYMARFSFLKAVLRDRTGSSAVEYGIILAMIALVVFFAIQGVASETITMWETVSTKSANAIAGN